MATSIRLPTTPVPPATPPAEVPEQVDGLCALLVASEAEATVADRVRRLGHRVDAVLVVDDGSLDRTQQVARDAGARVLRLPSARGEGVALRAGMRLARELGYIGAYVPGPDDLPPDALDVLVRAHLRAPEALVLGVGPEQALAGKEWDEAYALAEGREPTPYPDWRPPKADGWPGRVEDAFRALAETRYGYPWGGPRILPLQAVLRRPLAEPGAGVHMELLALAVHAGIPTVEVELPVAPTRPVVADRDVALRLLPRFWRRIWARRVRERLGLGGGYAPPTTSPLLLAIGVGLVLTGCPAKRAPVVDAATCPDGVTLSQWPGAGDPAAARDELLASRSAVSTVWVQQDVLVDDPRMGVRRLKGVMALDGEEKVRVRLLAPMGMTVIDYVQADGRWQLSVPPAGIRRSGAEGESPVTPEEEESAELGMRPDQIVALLHSIEPDAQVQWRPGACAVLEELDGGTIVRRLGFGREDGAWVVANEEIVEDGQVVARSTYGDYRSVGAGAWPWLSEVVDPRRGSVVTLSVQAVRTDGVTEDFFAMSPE